MATTRLLGDGFRGTDLDWRQITLNLPAVAPIKSPSSRPGSRGSCRPAHGVARACRIARSPLCRTETRPGLGLGERSPGNLGKARIRSRRLARIPSGGNDEVVDRVADALHTINRDAAAMSIAEEKAPGFRKQRRIGRLGHAEEDQDGCAAEVERMGNSKPIHPLYVETRELAVRAVCVTCRRDMLSNIFE